MITSMKININQYICFVIGFLLPLPVKFLGINLYCGEFLLFVFITCNAQRIINSIRTYEHFRIVWLWNYFLIMFISLYGLFVGDPGLHTKAALQYGFCLLIVLPGFCYLIINYGKSILYGIYLSLPVACFFLSQVYFFDLYLLQEIFTYNVTGGIFKRVGMTAVNDYAIILLVCSLIIICFELRATIKLIFLLITFYLILLTGSRVAIVGFVFLILFTRSTVQLSLPIKLTGSALLVALLFINYEHIDGLKRLIDNGLIDSERKNLIIDGLNHLNANPWGTGLIQYFNPKNGYPVHNFFVLALVELGLFFGILFLVSLLITLFSCVNFKLTLRAVPLVLMLMILSTITHGYDKFLWYLPAIVLGLNIRDRFNETSDVNRKS